MAPQGQCAPFPHRHHGLWLQAPPGAASRGAAAALCQQCQRPGCSLTAWANPPAQANAGNVPRNHSYEGRAVVGCEAPTGFVQREVMVTKQGQQQSCFALDYSQPSRDLHKRNSWVFGNWRPKTNNFQRPHPATGECGGNWVDPIGLMALGPANSSAAFPRAGKEMDIQIHFSEQPTDLFFTTHSPAPSSLAGTGPTFAEQ